MTTREYLLDVARSKLGDYRKGSPEVTAIWRECFPATVSDGAVAAFAKTEDWCGGFVLCCLREAKLTDAHWKIGSGFVLRVLGASTATKAPKPGDIAILQRRPGAKKDVWHHSIVESWNGPNDWWSIDGNTPACARKHHTQVEPTTTFYSIDRLLPEMPEAGFVRGQEFSVPGVQDK